MAKKNISDAHVIKLYKDNKSLSEIAEKYNTYPNKILRILKKHNIPRRSNSESQKLAIKTGRKAAPNDGSPLTEEKKIAISEGMSKHWKNASEEFKEKHREQAKDQWDKRSARKKKQMQKKARQGILKAAKNGSKIEVVIRDFLTDNGIIFLRNKKGILSDAEMEIDLYIPEFNVALEVDGIYHQQAIHDQDSFERRKKADRKKNALAIKEGFWVVRVRILKKNLSNKNYRDICNQVLDTMQNLPKKPKLINIDVKEN